MNKIYFLAICISMLLSLQNVTAQTPPSWEWVRTGGGTSTDNVSSSAIDSQGNVYVTGSYYSGTMTFGDQTITNNDPGEEFPARDIYVVKYNAQGDLLWVRNFGAVGHDDVYGITTDSQDNFYIGGAFGAQTISFDALTLTNTNDNNDFFLVKFDSNGTAIWARSATGTEFDNIKSITSDAEGNIYATGVFNSPTLDFGNDVVATITPGTAIADVFVVKYNNEGIAQWVDVANGRGFDEVYDIKLDAQGNIYIVGFFYSGQITFGNTLLTNTNQYGDIFITKYSSDGSVLWARKEGGNDDDRATTVALDNYGNLYIGGFYMSTSITIGNTTLNNPSGSTKLLVAKYNASNGSPIWAKSASGSSSGIQSIVSDSQGSIYAMGQFYSLISFTDWPTINSVGDGDILLVKYNEEGTVEWIKTTGSTSTDFGKTLTINGQNQIYAAGNIGSSADFDGSQTSGEAFDVFLSKINTEIMAVPSYSMWDKLTVYPNPAKNSITVTGNSSNTNYTITDALGRTVKTGTMLENIINTSSLPSGLYILNINNETSTKFIKE